MKKRLQVALPYVLLGLIIVGLAGLTGCDEVAMRLPGATATSSPTASPTATPTSSPTPTVTASPTVTPSVTPSVTPTASPTVTPSPTPSPTALPLQVSFKTSSRQLAQGQTLALVASANRPCSLSGSIAGRPLRFTSITTSTYLALVGFDAVAEPGEKAIYVQAQSPEGQRLAFETSLPLTEGDFPSEQLTFDRQTAQLLDPDLLEEERKKLQAVYAGYSQVPYWREAFQWPFTGPITSPYGSRRLYQGELQSFHAGIDVDGETGDPIRASAAGSIALAEELAVHGNTVIIDHGLGVYSVYCHLSGIDVTPGQWVDQGQLLGAMGSTGLSTGSHLHWEMRVQGASVDPREWTEATFLGIQQVVAGAEAGEKGEHD